MSGIKELKTRIKSIGSTLLRFPHRWSYGGQDSFGGQARKITGAI